MGSKAQQAKRMLITVLLAVAVLQGVHVAINRTTSDKVSKQKFTNNKSNTNSNNNNDKTKTSTGAR